MSKKSLNVTLAVAALCACWPIQYAHAYIDPGSGSALVSMIIGFFVACGLFVKTYWYKLKRFFSSKRND